MFYRLYFNGALFCQHCKVQIFQPIVCFVLGGEVGCEFWNCVVMFVLLDSEFPPSALFSLYHPTPTECFSLPYVPFVSPRSYAFWRLPLQIACIFKSLPYSAYSDLDPFSFFRIFKVDLSLSGWVFRSRLASLSVLSSPFFFAFACHKVLWQSGMEWAWEITCWIWWVFASYLKVILKS